MTTALQTEDHLLKSAEQLIRQKRFEAARGELQTLLDRHPAHIEALYLSAVCARYLRQYDQAQKSLMLLHQTVPEFGRGFQEEGHLARDQGQSDKALAAYQRACMANPALIASWRMQAELLSKAGYIEEGRQAGLQAQRLAELPRELLAVTNYIYEDKLLKAENLCKAYLQRDKTNVEGMRLLADIAQRLSALEESEFLLQTALELAPEHIQIQLDYIQLLRKRQKFTASLAQAKKLNDKYPNNPVFQSHYAIECMQTGDYDQAFELFEAILEKLPNDPATLTSHGHALKTFGRHEEAVASYKKAYQAKPDHGDAYYGLANLKTYKFSDDELSRMQQQEARPDLTYQNRIHLCFSIAKAHEDRKNYQQAFEYYRRGNELKRIQSRYDADKMSEELQAQISICTEDMFRKFQNTGCPAPDPIFILGLPRAGSTLLEQIIASHSQVDGTLELPNILSLAHDLRGKQKAAGKSEYPAILHDLSADQLTAYGEKFIEETRIHRQGAPFFIDKMPNNFRHIALIHLMLPNAKIIDARRHPMDCCFSGFKQLFAEGQEFTYGLEVVGQYYRDYVALMDHWDKVLPGKVLRVQYEDVVADTQTQVRRILDYLGLPFEQACIDFHKTERSVRTASSEQVRQPINTKGIEQWRHFEPWLEPLKTSLGTVLDRYPIPAKG